MAAPDPAPIVFELESNDVLNEDRPATVGAVAVAHVAARRHEHHRLIAADDQASASRIFAANLAMARAAAAGDDDVEIGAAHDVRGAAPSAASLMARHRRREGEAAAGGGGGSATQLRNEAQAISQLYELAVEGSGLEPSAGALASTAVSTLVVARQSRRGSRHARGRARRHQMQLQLEQQDNPSRRD